MMRPTLTYHPDTYAFRDINVRFANGVPLTPDQLNFIYENQSRLMFFSHTMNEIVQYYLRHLKSSDRHRLESLDKEHVEKFKRHLATLLAKKHAHVVIKMKPEEFLQLRSISSGELILYHGNQYLSGAPFYPGGIPHVLYFQWGNLFGVAKYVVLPEERALASNVLIYFEGMHDRYLEECVKEYEHQLKETLAKQKQLQLETPALAPHSPYQLPRLTLSVNTGKQEDAGKH